MASAVTQHHNNYYVYLTMAANTQHRMAVTVISL